MNCLLRQSGVSTVDGIDAHTPVAKAATSNPAVTRAMRVRLDIPLDLQIFGESSSNVLAIKSSDTTVGPVENNC